MVQWEFSLFPGTEFKELIMTSTWNCYNRPVQWCSRIPTFQRALLLSSLGWSYVQFKVCSSATINVIIHSKTWGFHSGERSSQGLLGCDTTQRIPTWNDNTFLVHHHLHLITTRVILSVYLPINILVTKSGREMLGHPASYQPV
jgi:hypothetical protein